MDRYNPHPITRIRQPAVATESLEVVHSICCTHIEDSGLPGCGNPQLGLLQTDELTTDFALLNRVRQRRNSRLKPRLEAPSHPRILEPPVAVVLFTGQADIVGTE